MSRVWTFIISKALGTETLDGILNECQSFVDAWTAHNNQLKASAEVIGSRIIVIKVDESVFEASGCSIDKLTRFMSTLENKYDIQLLNRMLVAYKKNENIEVIPATKVRELLTEGALTPTTTIFNTAVSNSHELAEWEQSLEKSWLKKYLS